MLDHRGETSISGVQQTRNLVKKAIPVNARFCFLAVWTRGPGKDGPDSGRGAPAGNLGRDAGLGGSESSSWDLVLYFSGFFAGILAGCLAPALCSRTLPSPPALPLSPLPPRGAARAPRPSPP